MFLGLDKSSHKNVIARYLLLRSASPLGRTQANRFAKISSLLYPLFPHKAPVILSQVQTLQKFSKFIFNIRVFKCKINYCFHVFKFVSGIVVF